MSKPVEMLKDHYYWVTPEGGGNVVCAKWLGDKWDEVKPPKAPIALEPVKQIISGSKYNYTEQVGDSLVSCGFDTCQELSNHIIWARKGHIASK